MSEFLNELGRRAPQLALAILAGRQGGMEGLGAFQSGMFDAQQAQQAQARQAQLDEERQQQRAVENQRAERVDARADEAQRFQRIQEALRQLQRYEQQQGETASDPVAAENALLGRASSLESMFGVPQGQLSGAIPNMAQVVGRGVRHDARQLLDDTEARIQKVNKDATVDDTTASFEWASVPPRVQKVLVERGHPVGQEVKPSQLSELAAMPTLNVQKAAPDSEIPNTPEKAHIADAIAIAEEAKGAPLTRAEKAQVRLKAMGEIDATRRDPQRQPIQITVGNSGLTREQITAASGLRDDFRMESKDFFAARDGYERMLAAGTDPSPAGDVALLYGFMKLLDPNSVVRETEFATAAKTGSLPQQIQAAAERVVNGQRLTREQRADFMNRAKGLFDRAQKRQTTRRDNYKRIATQSGVPEDLVVVDDPPVDESGTLQPSEAAAPSGAPGPNPYRGRGSAAGPR